MFENIANFFKRFGKNEKENSKCTAKERLHLVLAQDRANISADFLEMMKQEIIEVIKKYIDIDEKAIDVRMTNKPGEDGTVGAPALYANIPIVTIKNEARKLEGKLEQEKAKQSKIEEKVEQEIQTESIKQDECHNENIEEDSKQTKQELVEENKKNEEQKNSEIKKEEKVSTEVKTNGNQNQKNKNHSNTKNKKKKGKRG